MISDAVDKIIVESFKKDFDKSYEFPPQLEFIDLLSLGELVDRLTIVNYKLYRLKDDVVTNKSKDFRAWAAMADVNLVKERANLKKCIDLKVSDIIRKEKLNQESSFVPETKKYGE